MRKNNIFKILTLIVLMLLITTLTFTFVACNDDDTDTPPTPSVDDVDEGIDWSFLNGKSDRVILFIGDGMGENHIKATEAYYEKELFFDDLPLAGMMTTSCRSQFQATDSAAAASAMATGEKFQRGHVAYENSRNYKSISEYAKEHGKGVGIVTTDLISGATPAGFSAHSLSRSDKAKIIEGQLESNIDIFLGAGLNTASGEDVNYSMYKEQFEGKGYTFCSKYSELGLESNKIIGAFSQTANYTSTDETPTLQQLACFAVDFLEEKYPNGYFLMVEGAHIDKRSSDKDIFGMMEHLDEFDNAIEAVSDKIADKDNYSMIVTSDHECGGLQYNGETKDEINDNMFSVTYHTMVDVRYYTNFKLKGEDVDTMPDHIDNTDIFRICYSLLIGTAE